MEPLRSLKMKISSKPISMHVGGVGFKKLVGLKKKKKNKAEPNF